MMNVVSEMLHWANRWSNILSKFSHLVALAANPWGDKRKKCWRSERQTPKPHTGSNCHCFHHNQKRLMLIYGQSCASASHGKVCGMCVTHSSMWHSLSLANVLKYEKFLFPVDTWSATAKVKRCLCFFFAFNFFDRLVELRRQGNTRGRENFDDGQPLCAKANGYFIIHKLIRQEQVSETQNN